MGRRKELTGERLMWANGEAATSLNLRKHLGAPKIQVDLVPVLDLIVLALLISLLFTRFLILPGVQVDLPKTELSIQQNASDLAVLTIANEGMLFFAGSVYEQNSIRQAFQRYVDDSDVDLPILLVKAEASMQLQQFLDLCQMAQDAGFREVQIAADPKKERQDLTADKVSGQSNEIVFPAQ